MSEKFTFSLNNYIVTKGISLLPFIAILIFSHKSIAQCSTNAGTQNWSTTIWTGGCNNSSPASGGTFNNSIIVNGLSANETLSFNIDLNVNGGLTIADNADNTQATFIVKSGKTLNLTSGFTVGKNIKIVVETGATLNVNGSLTTQNNFTLQVYGTMKANDFALQNYATIDINSGGSLTLNGQITAKDNFALELDGYLKANGISVDNNALIDINSGSSLNLQNDLITKDYATLKVDANVNVNSLSVGIGSSIAVNNATIKATNVVGIGAGSTIEGSGSIIGSTINVGVGTTCGVSGCPSVGGGNSCSDNVIKGGSVSPANSTKCGGSTSGALTVSGYTGMIIGWEYSVSPFTTWTAINSTSATYTSAALTQTTQFRAVIKSATGYCIAKATAATVTINTAPLAPTVTGGAGCVNSSVTLSATAAGTGQEYKWYTAQTGGIAIATTTGSYTTPALTISTTYYVSTYTTVAGCESTRSAVTATINPKPTVTITNPAAVCSPGTVDLTAAAIKTGSTAGLTYTYWTNEAATAALALPSAVSASGTYYIKGTTAAGCLDVKPVIVTINPKPTVTITNPAAVCSPGTVDLTAATIKTGSTAGLTYTYWTNEAATAALALPSAVSASGTYYIKGTTAAGCSDVKAVIINVKPVPTVTLPSNITVCNGGTVSGTSFASAPTGATFTWTNSNTATGLVANGNGNVPSFTAINSTSSAITATISVTPILNGCTGTASNYTITVNPSPNISISASSTAICSGTNVVFTANPTNAGVSPSYQWKLNGVNVGTTTNLYSSFALNNGDKITCILTSNTCNTTATSNMLTMAVTANSWIGGISTDWNTAGNWCGGIPTEIQDVIISSGNNPVIDAGNSASCKSLTISTGASLTVKNGTLEVNGATIVGGSFNLTDARGTATFKDDVSISGDWNDAAAASINFDGNIVFSKGLNGKLGKYNLRGAGKSVTINGKLEVPSLDIKKYSLTINGEVASATKIKGSKDSDLILGSAFNGDLKFEENAQMLNSLTLNTAPNTHVNLGTSLTINGNITFPPSGKIVMQNNSILTLDENATYTRASTKSFVEGRMAKVIKGVDKFIFPVGKDTLCRKIAVTQKTSASTKWDVQYYKASSTIISKQKDPQLFTVSDIEYWDLHRSTSTDAKVTLYYGESSKVSQNGELSHLRLAHYNGTIWESIDTKPDNGSTWQSGSITTENYMNDFSPVTLSSTEPIYQLPVNFSNFNLLDLNEGVLLEWVTSEEIDNLGFEVQRSTDGFKTYSNLGFVDGVGSTNSSSKYSFIDSKPLPSGLYYRLKQLSKSGDFKFSEIKFISFRSEAITSMSLYPNPAMGNVKLNTAELGFEDKLDFSIFGADGVLRAKGIDIPIEDVDRAISYEVSKLMHGTYQIVLINNRLRHSKKFVKL